MGVPGARPSLYGELVYVPTLTGLVEVYLLSDLTNLSFTLGSSGRIVHPLSVSSTTISWTTDQGYIYACDPAERGLRYRFQALDTISSAPVQKGSVIYATSMDGFAYAIDDATGEVIWRYSVGEPISSSPLVVQDRVFVFTEQGQMVCLDADQGEARWSTLGVERFLAAKKEGVVRR